MGILFGYLCIMYLINARKMEHILEFLLEV
jgi:hypothetical protein